MHLAALHGHQCGRGSMLHRFLLGRLKLRKEISMPSEINHYEFFNTQILKATTKYLHEVANIMDSLAISIENQNDSDNIPEKHSIPKQSLNQNQNTEPINNENKIYTFKEACEYLKISKEGLSKLMKAGRLKSFRIGKCHRITQKELNKLVDS